MRGVNCLLPSQKTRGVETAAPAVVHIVVPCARRREIPTLARLVLTLDYLLSTVGTVLVCRPVLGPKLGGISNRETISTLVAEDGMRWQRRPQLIREFLYVDSGGGAETTGAA